MYWTKYYPGKVFELYVTLKINKGEGANSKQLHFKSKLQRLQNMSDVGDYTDKSEYEE